MAAAPVTNPSNQVSAIRESVVPGNRATPSPTLKPGLLGLEKGRASPAGPTPAPQPKTPPATPPETKAAASGSDQVDPSVVRKALDEAVKAEADYQKAVTAFETARQKVGKPGYKVTGKELSDLEALKAKLTEASDENTRADHHLFQVVSKAMCPVVYKCDFNFAQKAGKILVESVPQGDSRAKIRSKINTYLGTIAYDNLTGKDVRNRKQIIQNFVAWAIPQAEYPGEVFRYIYFLIRDLYGSMGLDANGLANDLVTECQNQGMKFNRVQAQQLYLLGVTTIRPENVLH
jgi:hypothetical protein